MLSVLFSSIVWFVLCLSTNFSLLSLKLSPLARTDVAVHRVVVVVVVVVRAILR